ncbi:MAG: DMT family transporter [Wenzhouxiangella sp.]|nr:MAG: DMT family transporter [Wenzhouxiangella sp.]
MISFASVFARLAEVAPTTSAFYRMVFGTLTFAILLLARPEMRTGLRANWAGSLLIGALFAADLWFWHRSIIYIGPGLATLLANFQVFILTAVGVIWFRERLGWRFSSGLGLAMLGLWLLFGREWAILSPEFRLGVILGLLTALAYALYLLSLRGLQIRHGHIRPEARLAQVTICCGLILGILNFAEGNSFAIPDLNTLLVLIALGVFCQVLGWLFITRGMPFLPAGLVGLLLLLQPSASISWDMIVFGLRLGLFELIGVTLALAGIYLGFRSAARQRVARPKPSPSA